MKKIRDLIYRFLFIFIYSCEEVSLINSRACDEEISALDKWRVKIHMIACKWCKRYNDQINLIHRILHRHCHGHLHQMAKAELSDESKSKIKAQISI